MAKRDLRNATLTIRDGTTPTPLSTEIFLGTGNATWTENTPMEYETEKGLISSGTVRRADEQPVEVSITSRWERVTSVSGDGEPITPYELLKAVHTASAAITTGADVCEPYACEMELTFLPNCGSEQAERVVFNEFRAESCVFDPQAGTLAITGKSKQVTPTYDRPDPPANTVAPSVSTDGTPSDGETITRVAGTWTGEDAAQSGIQWYRADDNSGLNEAAIVGATANGYLIDGVNDSGKYLSFKLTYTSPYGTATAQSNRVLIA